MSHRDQVAQILDVQGRGTHPLWMVKAEFTALRKKWDERLTQSQRYRMSDDFYPIRCVTLIEVFTRRWIADLIDHGSPFTEKGVELAKSIKIDYDVLHHIQEKKITLGEIVAHNVSLSSFDQVISVFEKLLSCTFLRALASITTTTPTESSLAIADIAEFAKVLAQLFRLRHILCHELPSESQYRLDEITVMLKYGEQYAYVTSAMIEGTWFPERLKSFFESTQDLILECCELDQSLDALIQTVPVDDESSLLWTNSQRAWEEYKNSQCMVRADLTRGASLSSRLWVEERARLTRLRYAEVNWYATREHDQLSPPLDD